jgi:hypothetical protein
MSYNFCPWQDFLPVLIFTGKAYPRGSQNRVGSGLLANNRLESLERDKDSSLLAPP